MRFPRGCMKNSVMRKGAELFGGPSVCVRQSDDLQADVDIAAGGVGVGAYLMGFLDQRFGVIAGKARQRHRELDVEAKAAGRARPDADGRGDGRIGWNLRTAL